jgi:hypothetical protein
MACRVATTATTRQLVRHAIPFEAIATLIGRFEPAAPGREWSTRSGRIARRFPAATPVDAIDPPAHPLSASIAVTPAGIDAQYAGSDRATLAHPRKRLRPMLRSHTMAVTPGRPYG